MFQYETRVSKTSESVAARCLEEEVKELLLALKITLPTKKIFESKSVSKKARLKLCWTRIRLVETYNWEKDSKKNIWTYKGKRWYMEN